MVDHCKATTSDVTKLHDHRGSLDTNSSSFAPLTFLAGSSVLRCFADRKAVNPRLSTHKACGPSKNTCTSTRKGVNTHTNTCVTLQQKKPDIKQTYELHNYECLWTFTNGAGSVAWKLVNWCEFGSVGSMKRVPHSLSTCKTIPKDPIHRYP